MVLPVTSAADAKLTVTPACPSRAGGAGNCRRLGGSRIRPPIPGRPTCRRWLTRAGVPLRSTYRSIDRLTEGLYPDLAEARRDDSWAWTSERSFAAGALRSAFHGSPPCDTIPIAALSSRASGLWVIGQFAHHNGGRDAIATHQR